MKAAKALTPTMNMQQIPQELFRDKKPGEIGAKLRDIRKVKAAKALTPTMNMQQIPQRYGSETNVAIADMTQQRAS